MGINLEVQSESWGVDDRSWLGLKDNTTDCRSITLDITKFTVDHYPNGFIPSGCVLGVVTAGGLYGPYDDTALDGRQTAVGFLFTAVQLTGAHRTVPAKSAAALYWHGLVITAKLPDFLSTANAKGELDANGRVDLAAKFRFE